MEPEDFSFGVLQPSDGSVSAADDASQAELFQSESNLLGGTDAEPVDLSFEALQPSSCPGAASVLN